MIHFQNTKIFGENNIISIYYKNGNMEIHFLFREHLIVEYSNHLEAGPSGFQMVISRTFFVSGFSNGPAFKWSGLDVFVQLSNGFAAILFLPFESRTGYFSH
jgi:hypothetical protein